MLEIQKKPKVTVKVFGEVYELERADMGLLEEFEELMEDGKRAYQKTRQFVVRLGLPDDVAKALDPEQLKALIEHMTPKKSG